MKVLWVSPKLPYPPESGDKLRQFNIIRHLSPRVDINLVAFTLTEQEAGHAPVMRQYCSTVNTFFSPNPSYAKRLRSIFASSTPYYVSRYQDAIVTRHITNQIKSFQPDIVQVEHTYMADYLRTFDPDLRRPSVMTKHNIDADLDFQSYRLADTQVKKLFWWLEWKKMSKYEPYADSLFSTIVVMSQTDKAQLMRRKPCPRRIEVVENGVDTEKFKPLPKGKEPVILFVGAFDYLPNQDAAVFLCREIHPLLQTAIPDVRILLVGRKPSSRVLDLASSSVEVHPDVPDVEPYYRRAAISVVPLRAGSGSRLKILEAMALGRPVVSTGKGAEGLEIVPGQDFLEANDPVSFAESIRKLVEHPGLYTQIAANARRTVEENYDWSAAAGKMLSIYQELLR